MSKVVDALEKKHYEAALAVVNSDRRAGEIKKNHPHDKAMYESQIATSEQLHQYCRGVRDSLHLAIRIESGHG